MPTIWATDLTYIPMEAWIRLSGCDPRLGPPARCWRIGFRHDDPGLLRGSAGEAIVKFGTPEIFNTDQGSQFLSTDFAGA